MAICVVGGSGACTVRRTDALHPSRYSDGGGRLGWCSATRMGAWDDDGDRMLNAGAALSRWRNGRDLRIGLA